MVVVTRFWIPPEDVTNDCLSATGDSLCTRWNDDSWSQSWDRQTADCGPFEGGISDIIWKKKRENKK
jgi:hypothetical protein